MAETAGTAATARAGRGRIVVVGAGISGLAAAHAVAERAPDLELLVVEAEGAPGGKVRTVREEGFVVEGGPNGFLDDAPGTLALAERVGLGARVVRASDESARRWVWLRGALRRIPEGPGALLRSDVLSWPAKLRLALEPLVPRRRGEADESVLAFARRRLGAEAADALVAPMVGGIYAGDAAALSVGAAFPKIVALERAHGSLVLGAIARMRARRAEARAGVAGATGRADAGAPRLQTGPVGRLTSFQQGLAELPARLAERLGRFVRTAAPARRVARDGARWTVELADGTVEPAAAVVLAVPADAAARLCADLPAPLVAPLAAIPLAPVGVVALGFERAAVAHPLDGFGFLVAPGEGLRILGCLFDSTIWPGRAPAGRVLLRAIVGGARDPGALDLDDDALTALVREDLRAALDLRAEPVYRRLFRWPRGIPQYALGHAARVAAADRAAATLPGLVLAGNSLRGVAFNACIEAAPAAAGAALRAAGGWSGPTTT
jgi:oxygen-dependent protoporphyrinogen oxidase